MGLMHDALAQIEGKTSPVPVILSLARAQQPAVTPHPAPRAAPMQFTFPELSEPQEPSPAGRSPQAIWPNSPGVETTAACAKMAEAMLCQLSRGRPRVAAFTSPGDGDGKTSLLMALGPQLAQRTTGGVLAVDANFHKPSLAARVRIPAGQSADRSRLIYPTNLPRLSFLAASTEQPSRCLDPAWIEELREGWSLVLLDMASLAHAEVAPLLGQCDGVYLVVRLGYTPQRAVTEAARVIRAAGGRLLGCAVVG
jgi:Mrp family chromosome partitioning ATPase